MYKMTEIRIKKRNLFTYVLMTTSFIGSCSIFQGNVGSLQWILFYYGCPLLLTLLSIYHISLNKDVTTRRNRIFFIRLFCVPRALMLFYSCILWCVSSTAIPYISRGVSNTLFQCAAYFWGVCIACGEKDDILEVTLASVVTVFGLAYFCGFIQNGASFLYAFNPLDSTADNFRKYTELHELAYIVGLCILINSIVGKYTSLKREHALFWISVMVFIIAWKRIGIFAVVVTYLYFVLFSRSKKNSKSFFVKTTGIIGTIICIAYVSLIVSGVFVTRLQSAGIDLMGRDIIYTYFRQFVSFSFDFMGKGMGFVSRQFDYTTRADLYNMVSIKALHNDFFKMYIELGFIGFIVWVFWWLIKMPQIIQKRYGIKKAFICLLFVLYAFVLYTTDNAESYTYFQMLLSIFITHISCFYNEQKGENFKRYSRKNR